MSTQHWSELKAQAGEPRARISTAASAAVSLRPIPMETARVGAAVAASVAVQNEARASEARIPVALRKKAA